MLRVLFALAVCAPSVETSVRRRARAQPHRFATACSPRSRRAAARRRTRGRATGATATSSTARPTTPTCCRRRPSPGRSSCASGTAARSLSLVEYLRATMPANNPGYLSADEWRRHRRVHALRRAACRPAGAELRSEPRGSCERRHRVAVSLSTREEEPAMDKINPLFTATATASGGRNGRTESDDGIVKADLSVPKAMGGPGKPGTATPEHLFAAGYAACFGGALDFVGKQHKKDARKRRSRARSRSARATAAASASPSRCASRTSRCRKPSSRRSCAKRTRRFARTRTRRAATSTCSSRSSALRRGRGALSGRARRDGARAGMRRAGPRPRRC